MSTETPVIHPKFHHVNLKTTRLREMIDWYSALVGAEVLFRYELGAWLSNDQANHRIALLAFPGFADDPEKETRIGLHHTAFEYASFDDLNASDLRLKAQGIVPDFCLDHGMTFSYYYRDPDGNHVELQVSRADVVERHGAGHLAVAADVDRVLGLVVDVVRVRRREDVGLAVADQRVGELGEPERIGRDVLAGLGGVVSVVQAEADDLLRVGHRRQQADPVERDALVARADVGT